METIKFRVWNSRTKKWQHGPGNECNLFGETILLGGFCQVSLDELNALVSCQYTGCEDKNGKEIYENDVLSYKGFRGIVSFIAGMFVIDYPDQTDSGPIGFLQTSDMEVIGTMFDFLPPAEPKKEEVKEEEEDLRLERCEQCGEEAWDGYICHACGAKDIGE